MSKNLDSIHVIKFKWHININASLIAKLQQPNLLIIFSFHIQTLKRHLKVLVKAVALQMALEIKKKLFVLQNSD